MRLKSFLTTLGATLGTLTTLEAGCGYDGFWDIDFGYRHDNFKWSLAAQDGTPNIFAEIEWPDIHCIQVGTRYILSGWDSIYLRGEGYFGWIMQAENIYSVYLGNDRTDLYSREKACRSGDKVYSGKIGLGAHLLRTGGPFDLAFLAGYSTQGLRLRWRDPKLIFNQVQPIGPVVDLVAKYRPKWNGGFVAMDGFLRWRTCITFTGSYEVHWATYRAHGVWNWTQNYNEALLNVPQEFYRQQWKDCGTAWGHVISGSLTYNSSENWYLGLVAYAQYFRSRGCDYDVYEFDNTSNINNLIYVVTLPNNTDNLNPTTWISWYVGFTLECQF